MTTDTAPAGDVTLRVRAYEVRDRPAWNDLVARSRAPHVLLQREYLEYHADRFDDCSLVVTGRNGVLVAALPASRSGDVVTSHGGLTFGGVVAGTKLGGGAMLDVVAALARHLRDEVGASTLRYKPVPHVFHAVPADDDLYALTRLGARLVRRDLSSAIDLRGEATRYSKGRRQSLAASAGQVEVVTSDDFDAWHAMQAETLVAHGVAPVHSADELRLLAGRFPRDIRLLAARAAGDPGGAALATAVTFRSPVAVHTQYLAQTPASREVGALDVLIDHVIRAARTDGARWLSFGISSHDEGRRLNRGLLAFKESFGGRPVAFDQYELSLQDASVETGATG